MSKFLIVLLVVLCSVFTVSCTDEEFRGEEQVCVNECEMKQKTCEDDIVMVCQVNESTGCTEFVEEMDCLNFNTHCSEERENNPFCDFSYDNSEVK